MVVVTTMELQDCRIVQYKGIVRGVIVRSPTIMQGFFGSLKNIVGGQIGAFTSMCDKAREQAYELMIEHATEMGANAILGMRYDASEVASKFSATEVICYGTAVVIAQNK